MWELGHSLPPRTLRPCTQYPHRPAHLLGIFRFSAFFLEVDLHVLTPQIHPSLQQILPKLDGFVLILGQFVANFGLQKDPRTEPMRELFDRPFEGKLNDVLLYDLIPA